MARRIKGSNPAVVDEYRRQRRRVQSLVRRAEKRGYKIDENIIPDIPKNVTEASVRRLSRITPTKLYEKSTHLAWTGETMEEISGTEYRRQERRKSATLGAMRREQKKWDREHPSPIYRFPSQSEYPMTDEEYDEYYGSEERHTYHNDEPPVLNEQPESVQEEMVERIAEQWGVDLTQEEAEEITEETTQDSEEPSIYDIAEAAYKSALKYGAEHDTYEDKAGFYHHRKIDEPYVPQVSIIDNIRDNLAQLPSKIYTRKGEIDLTGRKNDVMLLFEDIVEDYTTTNSLQSYVDYLLSNQGEIFTMINAITYSSEDESAEYCFVQLANLIKGSPLTPEEAKSIEDTMYEDVGDYEDYED